MKKLWFRKTGFGLIIFSVLVVVSMSVLLLMFNLEKENIFDSMEISLENDINSYSEDFLNTITEVSSDVFLIEQMVTTRDAFTITSGEVSFVNDHEKTRVEVALLDWLSVKTIYDQIRVLDLNGNELVRANYNQGNPLIVPQEDLQDKSGRYYFENSIQLDEDSLYISKLDLNVENGEIEIVDGNAKPMLRLATPIYNDDNQKVGVLIINYLVQDLFDSVTDLTVSDYSNFEILNSDGYYLNAIDKDKEFAFMYNLDSDIKFSKYHDVDILNVVDGSISQKVYGDELYTYIAVTETEIMNSILDSLGEDKHVVSETGSFVIVGEVEISTLDEYIYNRNFYIGISIVALMFVLVISRLIDETRFYQLQQISLLEYTSNHDTLTKLPNRLKLMNDVTYKMSRKHDFALLYLDFDGFKQINDTFGHDIGDLALIEGTSRIKDNIRQDDLLARIGGDEFVVILNSLSDKKITARIAQKIIDSFKTEFSLKNNVTTMGISIGIAFSADAKDVEELFNQADEAMYYIKENDKNDFSFYTDLKK